MNIYLVRHGQTDYNLAGIVQGQGVDAPLNQNGRRQADSFFRVYHHIPFDIVYTSELIRTHQSVELFLKLGVLHKIHPGLNEINWGIFEGKKPDSAQRQAFKKLILNWQMGKYDSKIQSGESAEEMWERQSTFIDDLVESSYKNVLICSHGRAMRALLCKMLDLPLKKMDNFQRSNLCLYQLAFKNQKFSLLKTNLTDHLRN